MNEHIGILGCGWLGTPLGVHLLAQGYRVKGSTTSPDKIELLRELGIAAFKLKIEQTSIAGNIDEFLDQLDVVILNIPPGFRNAEAGSYVRKMELLLDHIRSAGIAQVVFVSSISVYGDLEGKITEEDTPQPVSESGKQLLQAEALFRNDDTLQTTVIRFGGLIGGQRHPVFRLSGKTGLQNGGELINLIHLEDCIHMITTIIQLGYWGEIFNGVFPHHPEKQIYYPEEATKRGIPIPVYATEQGVPKRKQILNHNFFVKGHQLHTSIAS